MNFIRLIKILLVICFVGLICFKCFGKDKFGVAVFPDGTYFRLEVADTPEKMAKGMMFRKSLADDRGMVFVYPEPQFSSMWMKNCYISLDLIWLSEDGRIVYFCENVKPCHTEDCESYTTMSRAKYVLEVKHHTISKFKLKIGDRIRIIL